MSAPDPRDVGGAITEEKLAELEALATGVQGVEILVEEARRLLVKHGLLACAQVVVLDAAVLRAAVPALIAEVRRLAPSLEVRNLRLELGHLLRAQTVADIAWELRPYLDGFDGGGPTEMWERLEAAIEAYRPERK